MLPSLTTERLLLRPVEDSDAEAFFDLFSREENLRYLTRQKAPNIEFAKNHINQVRASVNENSYVYWAIQLQKNPTLIGIICLWNLDEVEKKADIGYELHPDFQGKGYVSEALKVVAAYGFQQMGLAKIHAVTNALNIPSIRVLERNNFLFIKKIPDSEKWPGEEDMTLLLYGLVC